MRCSTAFVLSLLLCLTAHAEPPVAAPAPAVIASIDDLLARLARLQGMRARYREEKRIKLLKRPLLSEGQILFAAPDLLLRRVEKPDPATLLLQGDSLKVADAFGTRSIDLRSNPIVKHFVLTFVHVLSGNRAALEQLYSLRFTRLENDGWQLQLTPLRPELARLIARATLEGKGLRVERMTIDEANGDVTALSFSDVDLGVRYSAAERARLIRLPGR